MELLFIFVLPYFIGIFGYVFLWGGPIIWNVNNMYGYGNGVASRLLQSILAAVLSTMLGAKDPDQVASMAKQAGEVRTNSCSTKISLFTIIIF